MVQKALNKMRHEVKECKQKVCVIGTLGSGKSSAINTWASAVSLRLEQAAAAGHGIDNMPVNPDTAPHMLDGNAIYDTTV